MKSVSFETCSFTRLKVVWKAANVGGIVEIDSHLVLNGFQVYSAILTNNWWRKIIPFPQALLDTTD